MAKKGKSKAKNAKAAVIETRERKNRWRLEEIVRVCEQRLQELTREAWTTRPSVSAAALARSVAPHLRQSVQRGDVETWDVTLCAAVLRHFGHAENESQAAAVSAIVAARNHWAHAAGGRVTAAALAKHEAACVRAFEALGGDAMALQRVRASEVDASDVQVLPSNRDATDAAEKAKTEGNRLFRANDFRAAEKCYTNGLQVVGAVDAMMLAQLFNNRSTARWHMQDFANAKQDAKRAAELAPHWSKPHVRLAAIYASKTKHAKAVARLEMALGLASAEHDEDMVKEIMMRMSEYRLRRDEEARCESENLAYGPMSSNEGAFRAANQARAGLDETEDPMAMTDKMLQFDWNRVGMGAKKHVILGQRARQDGRLDDAAREFMAAAVGGDAEGMYNYAICQLKGQGTRKDIPAAIRWLEKAAACPPTRTPIATLNKVGVREALTTLGSFYDAGIHFRQDKTRAREYWERAAELGAATGMNQFGLCLMNGTNNVQKDLPRAREMFRRSAEMLHNEAMSNLAALHGLLHEYETAARWADAAFRFGFVPAADTADRYRLLAAQRASVPKETVRILDRVVGMIPDRIEQPTPQRQNSTPTLDELRAIGTPYGRQLLMAKELMLKAMQEFTSFHPAGMLRAVELAGEAHRMEDGMLVFSEDENCYAFATATYLQDMGAPLTPNMVVLLQPPDRSAFVTFWKSMQLQFPDDLAITRRAASAHMFTAYAGADIEHGVLLFQRALSLLPHAEDDSDPQTLGVLYEAAVAYYQTQKLERAETLFARFLNHAPAFGHRKAAEAHFILGLITIRKTSRGSREGTALKTHHENTRAEIETALSAAAGHLRDGDALLERVPPFLRDSARGSPNRKLLERITSLAGTPILDTTATLPTIKKKWGGELVLGPRRHSDLRSETSTLKLMWRKSIAAMAEIYNAKGRKGFSWSTPTRQSATHANTSTKCANATIDELFSALKDEVHTGRMIDCIVVSVPSFNGSSHQFVVEDSQREPAKIAVYNAPQLLIAQLVPGRAFRLLHPYVRLANDGSIMLRVDDPFSTIKVQTLYTICWVCAVEQQPSEALKRCAKCHTALYCSKRCQTHDWSVDGHRFLCPAL